MGDLPRSPFCTPKHQQTKRTHSMGWAGHAPSQSSQHGATGTFFMGCSALGEGGHPRAILLQLSAPWAHTYRFLRPRGKRGSIFQAPLPSGLHQGLLPALAEGRVVPRRFPGQGGQAVPGVRSRGVQHGRCGRPRRSGASSLRPPFRRDPGRGARLPALLPGRPA